MKPLRTGQVAALLCVAARTVSKWCDSGALKSHRLPPGREGGPRHRRIDPAALLAFCLREGVPVPAELAAMVPAEEAKQAA